MPRTNRLAAAILAAVSFWAPSDWAGGPSPATAQPAGPEVCEPVDYRRLTQGLARRYGERPVALGAGDRGAVIVFASTDGATWTIVQLWPDGQACIAAAGEAWESLPPSAAPAVGEQS